MAYKAFMKTQSYREIQAGWRWMKNTDPEAAAAAKQWIEDHPEEWNEIERILYYSEANFHKRIAFDDLENAEMKQYIPLNQEAFLPEEVRNSIYQDKCWFDRSKYLPEESDEDPDMYLNVKIVAGLHELTELQREILFRNIINGESTESIARDKQCTSRNIRDIRKRALKQLRSRVTSCQGFGRTDITFLVVLVTLCAASYGLMKFAEYLEYLISIYPWLEYVVGGISAVLFVLLFPLTKDIEVKESLRRHWDSLHGPQGKK